MKKLLPFIIVLLSLGCDDELDGVPCDAQHTKRIGAKCRDGSTSSATGSGACSHHDGVEYFICK
jgi:hypothetical protein